jgi:hypothetical protein
MQAIFRNSRQQRLFRKVVSEIGGIGYNQEYLVQDYCLKDWFVPGTPGRCVPLAAFGRKPFSYDSACLAVLVSNGKCGRDLVTDFRALGAPIALEVGQEHLAVWRIGRDAGATQKRDEVAEKDIRTLFRKYTGEWSPQEILRIKNIPFELGPKQLDFFDLGLIPALESHITKKLDRLIPDTLSESAKVYEKKTRQRPETDRLFHLVFQVLAAKVLHDRKELDFNSLSGVSDTDKLLEMVGQIYGGTRLSIIDDRDTQEAVVSKIWTEFDFSNLSVEVLAYIYENTLVDPNTRKDLGIHSTPYSIARYIVRKLPIEDIPTNQLRIVEPCSGHGIFLVAALQRLRELLHATMTPQELHNYFVRMLSGYEKDSFAVEVSRLCLMLANLPNHDDWRLYNEDVFTSDRFVTELRKARVVLCNPPFEKFKKEDRARYRNLKYSYKPIELLNRVLENMHPEAMLGFVLPQKFLDGHAYRDIRRKLFERFEAFDLVSLPDRVFHISQHETALLIAKRPIKHDKSKIRFTFVEESDRQRFLDTYTYTWQAKEDETPAEAEPTIAIYPLRDIWERLSGFPRLKDIAVIHRGIEKSYHGQKISYSKTRQPESKKGYCLAEEKTQAFLPPPASYFGLEGGRVTWSDILRHRWEEPKVFVNAHRTSRGRWRYAAFIDKEGIISSKNFLAVWPRRPDGSLEYLAAILNSPLTNAFVGAHERDQHNKVETLQNVPVPRLSDYDMQTIGQLVCEYMTKVKEEVLTDDRMLRDILLRIDALILKGYNLPPRLERELLDYFREKYRPVPFEFKEYIPESFTAFIPLWMYISSDFKECTAQNLLSQIPQIKDPALIKVLEEVE